MPIMDLDFDHQNDAHEPTEKTQTDQTQHMADSGEQFDHLKILGNRFKENKKGEVNIRKGVSIEKTLRMKEDGKGGFTQEKEFDIIQHSQSNFEGVKGVLL